MSPTAPRSIQFALAFLIVVSVRCSTQADAPPGRWTSGDTTYVRPSAQGQWGSERTLVETLRIGKEDGAEEELIGSVQCVAADKSGGIYFFDNSVPALRYFDASGNFVRTLGREGAGPGEYKDACLGLAVRSDGKIIMREPRSLRINLYEPDGTPLPSWSLQSGLFTRLATRVGKDDNVYARTIIGEIERNKPWPIGMVVYSVDGVLSDTIMPPPPVVGAPENLAGRFMPADMWDVLSDGSIVMANSGIYAIEIRKRDGTIVRIDKPYDPVSLSGAERADYQRLQDWFVKYQGRFSTSDIPDLPANKAAFKQLFVDQDDRIWVERYQEGEAKEDPDPLPADESAPPPVNWVEPVVYDVFAADGSFLNRVHAPRGSAIYKARGDAAWGTQTDDGVQYVVSWALSDS